MSRRWTLPFGRLGYIAFVLVLVGVPLFMPQFWVTLGNIIAGAGFMGVGYWVMSRPYVEPVRAGAPVAVTLDPAE